jgi:hypothetical protein
MSAIGASVMAEVTSVNVVGFVNVTLPTDGWYILANPLNNTNNNLSTLLNPSTGLPATVDCYTYTPGAGYVNYSYYGDLGWNPDVPINPGQAFWLNVTSDGAGGVNAPFKLTFIGEVPQGNLTTPLSTGWNLVSSQVPQAGNLTVDLGYTSADDDDLYTWEGGNWVDHSPDLAGGFNPPVQLGIGQGFFLFKTSASSWARNFTVK